MTELLKKSVTLYGVTSPNGELDMTECQNTGNCLIKDFGENNLIYVPAVLHNTFVDDRYLVVKDGDRGQERELRELLMSWYLKLKANQDVFYTAFFYL